MDFDPIERLLKTMFKKYKKICLTTNKGYAKLQAIHLYKKLGFKLTKERGKTSSWYKK